MRRFAKDWAICFLGIPLGAAVVIGGFWGAYELGAFLWSVSKPLAVVAGWAAMSALVVVMPDAPV